MTLFARASSSSVFLWHCNWIFWEIIQYLLSSRALISNETSTSCADYVIMLRVFILHSVKWWDWDCVCVRGSDGGWFLQLWVCYIRGFTGGFASEKKVNQSQCESCSGIGPNDIINTYIYKIYIYKNGKIYYWNTFYNKNKREITI